MKKHYQVTCPTKDMEVNLCVEYIPAKAFTDLRPQYTKGRMACSHVSSCERPGSCTIYERMPHTLIE